MGFSVSPNPLDKLCKYANVKIELLDEIFSFKTFNFIWNECPNVTNSPLLFTFLLKPAPRRSIFGPKYFPVQKRKK
jgi:hypothetical protein